MLQTEKMSNNAAASGLLRTFPGSALVWQSNFSCLWMNRQLYDYWLTRDYIPERQNKPGHIAAIVENLVVATEFGDDVSGFRSAIQVLNSTLPLQMRIYQIPDGFRNAVAAADDVGRRERVGSLEQRALKTVSHIQEATTPENQSLRGILQSSADALRYARPYTQRTLGLWNRTISVAKLGEIWFNEYQAELMNIGLGCMAVVNQCLRVAETAFLSKFPNKDHFLDSTYPLLGELGLGLVPLSALRGKLFVFFRSAGDLGRLRGFSRVLERSLNDFYDPRNYSEPNPPVRVSVDLIIENYTCVVQFRDRREVLAYTVDVIFSYRDVLKQTMNSAKPPDTVAFNNGLILLRELFILKHVAAFPEMRFGILLLMHLRRQMPNLQARIWRWDLVSLIVSISDSIPFQDLSTVVIRGISLLELSDITSYCPQIPRSSIRPEDMSLVQSLDPFVFRFAEKQYDDDFTERSENLTASLDEVSTKLKQQKIADVFAIEASSDVRDQYRCVCNTIRDVILAGLRISLPPVKTETLLNHHDPSLPVPAADSVPLILGLDQIPIPPEPDSLTGRRTRPDPRQNRHLLTSVLPVPKQTLPVAASSSDIHLQAALADIRKLQQQMKQPPGSLSGQQVLTPTSSGDMLPNSDPPPVRQIKLESESLGLPDEARASDAIMHSASDGRNYHSAAADTLRHALGSDRTHEDYDAYSEVSELSHQASDSEHRDYRHHAVARSSLGRSSDKDRPKRKLDERDRDGWDGSVRLQLATFGTRTEHGNRSRSPKYASRTTDRHVRPCNESFGRSSRHHSPERRHRRRSRSPIKERPRRSSLSTDQDYRPPKQFTDSSVSRVHREIYVQDIHQNTVLEDLEALFAPAAISNLDIHMGRSRWHSKSQFAWLYFDSVADAEAAMELLQGALLDGRKLRLSYRGSEDLASASDRFDVCMNNVDTMSFHVHNHLQQKFNYKVEDVFLFKNHVACIQFAHVDDAKAFLEKKFIVFQSRKSEIYRAPNSKRLR